MTTIKQILQEAVIRLSKVSDTPHIDAESLLTYVLNKNRAYLHAHADAIPTSDELNHFHALLAARTQGQPIAYLIAHRGFWDDEFIVNEHTLIPRPETELLIELALENTQHNQRILDLGTGSGIIAITLAKLRAPEHWHVTATDIDPNTLAVAQRNAAQLHAPPITFLQSNWFDQIPNTGFDMIISNPPYLAWDDPHLTQGDLRFEPRGALACDDRGFAALQAILTGALRFLVPGGTLLLEHGHTQQPELLQRLCDAGYRDCEGFSDVSGTPRAVRARRPT